MKNRRRVARRLSWLAVAALTTAALFAPVATSRAASVAPTHPAGNPTCADLGYSLWFKIDTGDLDNTTYAAGDPRVDTNWDGQEITISGVSDDGQTFDWSSTIPVSAVLVKAGSDNNNLYTYSPPVTSDTDLTRGDGQQGISHLQFCGNVSTPTAPPTATPTAPPTATPTAPPTATPTAPPTASPTPNPTVTGGVGPITGTPTPTGGVAGATGAPGTTLPPTDAMGDASSAPVGENWRLILLAMAGVLAALLLLTPASAVVRKDRS